MTSDERRQQRVQVQMDLEDAEGALANLQVKAVRMADAIDEVSLKIRHNASIEPSDSDFDAEAHLANRLTSKNQEALGADVIGVIDELKAARQKVMKYARQKSRIS